MSKKIIIRSTTVPQSLNVFCKGILKELSGKYEVIGLSSPGEALDIVAEREGIRTIAVPMERHISLINDLKSILQMVQFVSMQLTKVNPSNKRMSICWLILCTVLQIQLRYFVIWLITEFGSLKRIRQL